MAESTETRTKVVRIVYDASKAPDEVRKFRRSLEEIERAAQQAQGTFARLEGAVGKVGAGFGLVTRAAGVFGIALSIGAVTSFAREMMQAVGGLGSLAEQLTTNTRYLQALQFAATGANVKMADLEVGAAALSRKIGQAAEGNRDAIETFQRLGVKILDAQGNVRPFNDLLGESAKALGNVDNANVKSALSAELFEKAGRRMLTLLPELTRGEKALSEAAEKAGTMITPETIDKWDKLGSAVEQQGLKWKAFAAENFFAPIAAGFRVIAANIELALVPLKAFIVGIDAAKGAGAWLGRRFTTGPGSGTGVQETLERIEDERRSVEGQPGAEKILARLDADRRRVLGGGGQGFAGTEPMDLATRYKPPTAGARDPDVKGSGGGGGSGSGSAAEGQRYDKLVAQLDAAAAAQDALTAASRRGEAAFQEQQVEVAAAKKAIAIYGEALAETDPRLRRITELMRREMQGKAAETFNVATTELQKQNVLLQAEIDLVGQLPALRAQELAFIKAKQEAEKAGTAGTAEDIERRRQAIEQNETLKLQQEELKKAQELWTEPLKQALRDIQTTAADAFEEMLNSGKFSFESLGQTFKKIVTRMAAEFLALATIRPVMNVVVNAIGGSGAANAMGLGGGSPTGSLMGGGGMGGFELPNFLGGGSISSFLASTPFASAAPAGGFASIDALMASGQAGASAGLSAGGIGGALAGTSMGSLLGAGAGLGMGAFQLLSGNGSTSSTIGGITSMVGGLATLIPGIGPFLGPAISILGSVLPGLFEAKKEPITNQAAGYLNYGSSGFYSTGGAWGPDANASSAQGPLKQVAGGIQGVFDLLGGVKDPGKVWGLGLESISKTGEGWDFQSTSSFLTGPGGQREAWRMNTGDMTQTGAAQVAIRSVLEGAVGELSETMQRALKSISTQADLTIETIGATVAEITAFDTALENLGKTISPMEAAFQSVDASLSGLYATAARFGLDTAAIDAAQWEQKGKVAQDFFDGLFLGLQEISDPTGAAVTRLDKERAALVEQNDFLVSVYGDGIDQLTNIELLYQARRRTIMEQGNAASLAALEQAADSLVSAALSGVARIQDLIRELSPGGALANLDPAGQYAGLRATSVASYAQALSSPTDVALIERSVADAQAFAEFSRSYYAGSPDYNRDRDFILQQQQGLQLATAQGAAQQLPGADPKVVQMFQQLANAITTAMAASNQNSAKRNADIDKVIGLLARLLANNDLAA